MSQTGRRAPGNPWKERFRRDPLGTVMFHDNGEEGQQSFINSDTLPTYVNDIHFVHKDPRQPFIDAGVKFLDIVEGDPMFQYVELPEGWKRVAAREALRTHIVDEKGRRPRGCFLSLRASRAKSKPHASHAIWY